MNDDFLLVHKSILPDLLPKVISAREKIQNEELSVTQACKEVGISRSVFYKYKDFVFLPDRTTTKKAIFTFKVHDEKGVLTALLKTLSESDINVLTISQEMPIDSLAYITMTLDIKNLILPLPQLVEQLNQIPHVRKVTILAYE